jgi:hypothetical protein
LLHSVPQTADQRRWQTVKKATRHLPCNFYVKRNPDTHLLLITFLLANVAKLETRTKFKNAVKRAAEKTQRTAALTSEKFTCLKKKC